METKIIVASNMLHRLYQYVTESHKTEIIQRKALFLPSISPIDKPKVFEKHFGSFSVIVPLFNQVLKTMPIAYITHKDRKILYVDISNMQDKQLVMGTFDEMTIYYKNSTEPIYPLLDITGAYSDPEVNDLIKHYGKTVFKGKSKKRAIVGMTAIKSIIVKGFSIATGTEVKAFNSLREAKDYLAA